MMEKLLQNLLTADLHGSIVILAVLLLRAILRKTPKKYICFLWMLAGLRLLLPVPLVSSLSLQPLSLNMPSFGRFLPVVGLAYGLLALIILSYSLISYLKLRAQVADAVKIRGGWESDKIETAFVLGFLKPKIYIPAGMTEDQRRQILAHERTHLDKGDHWIKLIGFLAWPSTGTTPWYGWPTPCFAGIWRWPVTSGWSGLWSPPSGRPILPPCWSAAQRTSTTPPAPWPLGRSA